MKMVMAYIRHEAFEPIRADLLSQGFPSLSVSEVKGSGRQKGITERYRGAELTNYLRPKVKIECVVAAGDVRSVVDTILRHARTGGVGAAFLLVFVLSYITFAAIKAIFGLRVDAEDEDAGLDIAEHGMYGYPEQFIPMPELEGYGAAPTTRAPAAPSPYTTREEVPAT